MNPLARSLADALVGSTSLTNDEVRAIVNSPHYRRIDELIDRLDDPKVTLAETAELDRLVADALEHGADRSDPWS